jgi:hypothetical protein
MELARAFQSCRYVFVEVRRTYLTMQVCVHGVVQAIGVQVVVVILT